MFESYRMVELEANIERIIVQESIDPHMARNMELIAYEDVVTRNMAVRLIRYIASTDGRVDTIEHISYPETWWDAFKERWYPKWMLRRWPAEHVERALTLKQVHMCPHLDIPPGNKTHYRFLWKEQIDGLTR